MKKILNTLYITTEGVYLGRKRDSIIIKKNDEVLFTAPVHTLSGIVCFGPVSTSPYLMNLCARKGVLLSYLSINGRFLARVQGPVSGNVLVRKAQYRFSEDPDYCARVARCVIIAKVINGRSVLLRAARQNSEDEVFQQLQTVITRLSGIINQLSSPCTLEKARGYEGEAARLYYSVFDHLITENKDSFFFEKRSRRPPLDNINALLSFIYTLLTHDITSAIEAVGLDPAVGFLHGDRPGKPGLALDLMEEFRPYLADRLALTLINRKQIKPSGFSKSESGAVEMDEETRKTVVSAWQNRKKDEITHPFTEEKMQIGMVPFVQALLFSRLMRDELQLYPPFIPK